MAIEKSTILDGGGNGGHRGPKTFDYVLGTNYSADIYYKGSYTAERHELAEKTELLIARAHLWSPTFAHRMVQEALDRSDPLNTSWIGFRKTDAPRGEYEGAAWQEEIHVPINRNEEKDLLHMMLRVFEPQAQGRHFGRSAMQLALWAHPDAELVGHRSGSPRAVRAWLNSGVFREGRRFPKDIPFFKAPNMAQVLLWVWENYHINGRFPNLSTGVSIGDYPEPNGAYVYDSKYRSIEEHEWMTSPTGLKMKLLRGDALYELGEVA